MNIVTIPATGNDPIKLDTTPLAGGFGREAKVLLGSNTGVASGVLLQGHAGMPDGSVPTTGDAGWYTVLSAPQTGPMTEIEDLPMYIRKGGATLTGPITLEGVQ